MRRSKRSNTPAPLHEAVKGAADGIARASAGDQAELFGLPCEDPRGEIEKARARGVREGRPKGAESIATRELRRWLLSRGVLPQQSLMQWFQLGPEGLAQALGCPKLEAFDRWARLGEKLGRYFMPMKPAKGEGGPAPQIVVEIGGSRAVVNKAGELRPPWEYMDEQNESICSNQLEPSKPEDEP